MTNDNQNFNILINPGTIYGNGEKKIKANNSMNQMEANEKTFHSIEKSRAIALTLGTFLMTVLYMICFTGVAKTPELSLLIFCGAALIILYLGLRKAKLLINKKAFLLSIPIIALASCNAIFCLTEISYLNIIALHLLFAILVYRAVSQSPVNLEELGGGWKILKTWMGNWYIAPHILREGFISDSNKDKKLWLKVLIGISIAAPFIGVIGYLMLDGDRIFNELTAIWYSRFFEDFNLVVNGITFVVGFLYFGGYIYNIMYMNYEQSTKIERKADTVISTTFLSLLNVLFMVFCYVQVRYLFMGHYHQLGVIYSEYAREGFFQLLFITVINFTVLIVFLKFFSNTVKTKPIRVLILLLCIFTGILIASSFYRMNLYIGAYGYTRLRMEVITFLTMEAVMLGASVYYLYSPKIKLITVYLCTIIVFLLGLNIVGSTYVITKLNIQKYLSEGYGLDLDIMNYDSVGSLIDLYDTTSSWDDKIGEHHLKSKIMNKINDVELNRVYQTQYTNGSLWQNQHLIQSLNERKVKKFLAEHPLEK